MKVLVVDADLAVVQTLQRSFARCNYAVDAAGDGDTGLQMAEVCEYDLIVLDLLLPQRDSVSLCQHLRTQGFQNPILLLIGQEESQPRAIALKAGVDDYVVKPFDAEALIARVQALLQRGEMGKQPMLTWGPLSIDPSSRNVAYGTRLLAVTPKEYAILEFFVRNPERTLSAQTILEHVWAASDSPGEAAVRAHIKELRQKLTAIGAAKDFIKTKHRVGYQLNPLYSSCRIPTAAKQITAPPLADLNAVNEELRVANEELQVTLEQLRATQAELEQKNQELQAARDKLEQRVADRTAELTVANQALQQREEFLSGIYNGADEAIFIIEVTETQDFRYLAFNYLAEKYAGVTQQDIQGQTPEAVFGAVTGAAFRQHYQRCLQASRSITYEECVVLENHALCTLTTLSPLRNEQGQVYRIVGTAIDITDRKQLEAERQQAQTALQEREELLRLALDLNAIGMWEWQITTGICTWNDQNYRLLGYEPGEVEPSYQLWRRHVHPDDVVGVEQKITQALETRTEYEAECRTILRDGSVRWEFGKGRGIYDEAGQPVRMIGVAFDISDRKQTEFALQQQIRQEHLLAEIAQDIRCSLNLEDVLSSTVHRVRELLNTDRVIIYRFRPDWQGDVIMESVGSDWRSILSAHISDPGLENRHYIEPYWHGRIAAITDIDTEDLDPCYVERLKSFQVKANLVVPILQGETLWGLLIAHQCSAPRRWQATEIVLLQRLATQVGIAIQQSELYEQTRRELSAREQMQRVLEESEARFRALSTAAPIGICQVSIEGICLYSNARWLEMAGLSLEDSLGYGWIQVVHPDDRAALITAWNAYLQGGSSPLPEFRLLTPQGEIRWISAQVAPLRSPAGEITGYVCTKEDITERKQAEQALRDSEQRLQAILDHAPAAIYLLDLDNRHLLANQSYAALLSTTPDNLLGRSLYEVWSPAIADTFAAHHRTVLNTGQLLQTEEVIPHPDGQQHTYITLEFPLHDEWGIPYAICGISTDITDKKLLEAQFYRAQRLESLGTLASGIAHDLNNVLTPILAIAQLLRLTQPDLKPRSQEMLQVMQDSAKRGTDMIQQILTFTRGTGGECSPIEIVPILQEVIHVVCRTFPKTIRIHQNISNPSLGLVSADATYLHQVFMNLCVNARDAMPDGGSLTLSVEQCCVDPVLAQTNLNTPTGNYVVVTIADTGTGIAPAMRDRIFDPFFTTKPQGKGTGLGLATVLGIVKTYGGFLQVFSEVGQGTQIKVYLPVVAAEASPHGKQPENQIAGSGELVLIVDDDVAVYRSTQALLESHDYITLVANSGAEAIELYSQHQADIKAVILRCTPLSRQFL